MVPFHLPGAVSLTVTGLRSVGSGDLSQVTFEEEETLPGILPVRDKRPHPPIYTAEGNAPGSCYVSFSAACLPDLSQKGGHLAAEVCHLPCLPAHSPRQAAGKARWLVFRRSIV